MYYLAGCIGMGRSRWSIIASLLLLVSTGHALEPLDDREMAGVAGRDGLSVQLNSTAGFGADAAVLSSDTGQTYGAAAILEGLALEGVGGPLNGSLELDVGTVSGEPTVFIRGTWSELVASIDSWSVGDPMISRADYSDATWQGAKSASLGSVGIQTSGSLTLHAPGLVDSGSTNAFLDLNSQGALFYRQGAQGRPELSFRNFSLGARFTDGAGGPGTGTFGIDTSGLLVAADHMDLDLFFDLYYAETPGVGNGYFDPDAGQPMILFGWEGGIDNASLQLGSGGIGTGTYSSGGLDYVDYDGSVTGNRSEGLNFTSQWDYGPNFAWRLGQSSASGTEVEVRFTDWQRLGGTGSPVAYDFNLPLILDTVDASHYPGGICFGGALPASGSLTSGGCGTVGGMFEDQVPQSRAFAMVMRDGGLHAYNSAVEVIDGATTDTFNWSLLYTFGKLDSNVWLYPEQRGGNPGLKADVLLAIQSPGYWEKAQALDPTAAANWASNTHFMIGDTNTAVDIDGDGTGGDQFAFGVMNADLLWKATNLFLRVTAPGEITGFPGGFTLESNSPTQYRFRGMLGGGNLEDMSDPVRMALVDVNLETDRFVFVLSPAPDPAEEYVGFDGLLDFNGNAFVSLAEPSNPDADMRLGSVSGRIRWQNGRVELRSSADNADGRPSLRIANDLLIGSTAGGNPLRGQVSLGSERLGEVVIPSGKFYSSITLKPQ